MPVRVNAPYLARSKGWCVRAVDADGKCRTTYRATQAEAVAVHDEIARQIVALAAPMPVAVAPQFSAPRGSASWWSEGHTWYAERLLAASVTGDLALIDREGRSIRAFAALSQSQVAQRDLDAMEADLTWLRGRLAELEGAAQQGSRVQMAGPGVITLEADARH